MCCSLKVAVFIRTLLTTHLRVSKTLIPGAVRSGSCLLRGGGGACWEEITKKQFEMRMMQIRVMRSEHLEQPGAFPGGKDGKGGV